MERYEKYKDSGIDWLGEIPEHWKVKRLKQIVSTKITDGPHTTPDFADEGIPFISAQAINHNRINFDDKRGYITKELDEEYSKKVKPQRHDIFIVKSGATTGRIACVETDLDFNIWSPLALVRANSIKIYYRYLFLQLQSHVFKTQIEIGWSFGTQENIGMGVIERLFIFVPTITEQTTIAAYLDRKTAEIDDLITKKEQLLHLYEEEKTALINQAVTKGLNPHVPMKDSGIDWLGEIPEHWEVKKLSYLFGKIGSGTTPKSGKPEYYENGSINWLQTGDLNDDEIYYTSKLITETALKDYSTLRFYPKDSIVIAMYGATIGKTGILKIEATTNQACCVLAEPENIKTKFAFYWFNSAKKHIISLSYGGGQPNINQEMIRTLKVQLPPKEEQVVIIQYVEKETARIDAKVTKTKKLIELLKEYKTALISEVVTGKIDIRNT